MSAGPCGGCFGWLSGSSSSSRQKSIAEGRTLRSGSTNSLESCFTIDGCIERLRAVAGKAQIPDMRIEDGVAVISLGGAGEEQSPWGTPLAEHRFNPGSILGFLEALDRVDKDASVSAVVVTAEGKFWSNGFDLKYIQTHSEHADLLQQATEVACARLLSFSKPTIAAVNGHATAAGAMLMLAFDVRVMNSERGFFFVPGIDLGLVYSPGMSALMASKLPHSIQRDVIVFGKRFTATTLLPHGVVDVAVPPADVLQTAIKEAVALKPKAKHPQTMSLIKGTLYHEAIAALQCEPDDILQHPSFRAMGFDSVPKGTDRPDAKPKKTMELMRRVTLAKAAEASRGLVQAAPMERTISD